MRADATTSQTPTGRAIIQLSSSTADNSIVLLPGANFSASASPHPRLPSSALSSYTHLLLQNEIPLQETRRTLRDAHAAGLVTLFNPSPMPKREDLAAFEWGALDWLVINAGEAEDLLVALASEEFAAAAQSKGPEALLRALRETSLRSLTGIIMTRGAEGVSCSLREHPGETMQVSAGKVVGGVKDTTGAGDCFTVRLVPPRSRVRPSSYPLRRQGYFATLLASLPGKVSSDEGASVKLVKHCLVVASQAAAMCVETPGAMESVPKLGDVITRMGERWKDVELSFPALEATP